MLKMTLSMHEKYGQCILIEHVPKFEHKIFLIEIEITRVRVSNISNRNRTRLSKSNNSIIELIESNRTITCRQIRLIEFQNFQPKL